MELTRIDVALFEAMGSEWDWEDGQADEISKVLKNFVNQSDVEGSRWS